MEAEGWKGEGGRGEGCLTLCRPPGSPGLSGTSDGHHRPLHNVHFQISSQHSVDLCLLLPAVGAHVMLHCIHIQNICTCTHVYTVHVLYYV